ncbi:MAG: hypothetical protein O3C21_05475 [Verrucomicrobia bacterium]|nr:hypothetical protein [Verrucomicrobiota bacterium]
MIQAQTGICSANGGGPATPERIFCRALDRFLRCDAAAAFGVVRIVDAKEKSSWLHY